jgi:hypothetical protein
LAILQRELIANTAIPGDPVVVEVPKACFAISYIGSNPWLSMHQPKVH